MDINFELELLRASRVKLEKIVTDLSQEHLFAIPKGFNNNIAWHIGHIIASQQRLIYMRSNLPMRISDDFSVYFQKGSSPLNWTKKPDVSELRKTLLETVEKLNEDIKNDIFKVYEPLKTSMGFMVNNYLQAFSYTNFHEAEHTGNIQYMIRILNS